MTTEYASNLRQIMLDNCRVEQVYDFRDSGVFEDATNYPAIVILEQEFDDESRSENKIRCVRVKSNVDENSGNELDKEIVESVREQVFNPGYSDDHIDVFDSPQDELSSDFWALMPPRELEVFKKLERTGDSTIGDVTDSVFHATSTSANKIYVVEVLDADRIEPDNTGDVVTVVPTGGSEQFEIETDLIRPFLKGDDVHRWNADWSGLHLIHPYRVTHEDGEVVDTEFCTEEYLSENLPLTLSYFQAHKEELEARERGRKRGEDDWYAYIYPKNLQKFENRKIVQAHVAEEATYMIDQKGMWYFTTAYGVLLKHQHRKITDEILCQLNSKPLDFYFKHIANIKSGGYYEYIAQYVEKVPCLRTSSNGGFSELRQSLNDIVEIIDTESRIDRFPEAYLGDFDGDLGYIDYEWQTRRYPVNADIQEKTDDRFAVTAGHSDELTDPLMDRGDREEQKLRARYVHAAVDGRNMKKYEEQTIPIPQSRDGVQQLIEALASDRQTVEETNINDLEAEIDQTVYGLFDLAEDEREVIEDYLEVF
jgi:hypothetical protein